MDGKLHNRDLLLSPQLAIKCALCNPPAKSEIQSGRTGRVKIKTWLAEYPCLVHNSLDESRAYPAPAVLWCDEHAGKPRCQRRANVHVTRDKTGGTETLVPGHRHERSWNLAMATVAFDSHRTIFHSLAGTEMAPLRMMPASQSGYELTAISKILDGHMQKCALTRQR